MATSSKEVNGANRREAAGGGVSAGSVRRASFEGRGLGPLLSPFEARARMSRRRAIRPSEELVGWPTLAFDLHRNLIYSANKGSNADKPLPAIVFEKHPDVSIREVCGLRPSNCDLRSISGAQFLHDMSHMNLHCAFAHVELIGDQLV